MVKRTTIEIDADFLERARMAFGEITTRGTVETALRRVTEEQVAKRAILHNWPGMEISISWPPMRCGVERVAAR